MKKTTLLLFSCIMLASSCQKTSLNEENDFTSDINGTSELLGARKCASQELLMQQLKADPGLAKRMQEIEDFTNKYMSRNLEARLVNGIYEIPVVVNVVYNTTAQNISLTQIQSQINVLNADYAATNSDYSKIPTIFQNVGSGNTNIRFVLDAVNRRATSTKSFSTNNAMKTSTSGIAPTSPSTKLNIWCCNLSNGVLGFAQFPGGSLATDGVVIDDNAFGTTGTVVAPFNKGRTGTHEVGHWLNLRHIWGDATCGSDLVNDTPIHNAANYGCPSSGHKSTCSGTPVEMTMNYMDYTDDACMYMFTLGQRSRMLAVFASGGPRNSFAQP